MAVKRKTKQSEVVSLPEALEQSVKLGMTASVLEKKFGALSKEHRGEIKEYLETNKEGFEIEASKAIKTEYGNVTFKVRSNFSVDSEKLIEAAKAGKVTLESLVSMAKFSADDLKKIGLGDAVSEATATEYVELRPNKDFKEEIEMQFGGSVEVEEKPAPKKKAAPKKDVASKAKAAAAKAKAKSAASKDADSDLDDILGA